MTSKAVALLLNRVYTLMYKIEAQIWHQNKHFQ